MHKKLWGLVGLCGLMIPAAFASFGPFDGSVTVLTKGFPSSRSVYRSDFITGPECYVGEREPDHLNDYPGIYALLYQIGFVQENKHMVAKNIEFQQPLGAICYDYAQFVTSMQSLREKRRDMDGWYGQLYGASLIAQLARALHTGLFDTYIQRQLPSRSRYKDLHMRLYLAHAMKFCELRELSARTYIDSLLKHTPRPPVWQHIPAVPGVIFNEEGQFIPFQWAQRGTTLYMAPICAHAPGALT